jgi:hypothetical protein
MALLKRSTFFTEPQHAFLEMEAARLGITVSDLLRRIVDEYREGKPQTMAKEPNQPKLKSKR